MKPLVNKDVFPGSGRSAYLNTASIALICRDALSAMERWQHELAESGTLSFDEAAEATVFDPLREAAGRLFNARAEDMAVGSNATELLASLAWALMPATDANIVSTSVTFPTTIYPFMRVARHTGSEVRLAQGNPDYVRPTDLVDLIDERTSVVCISHVEYASGQLFDLELLARVTHEHGALLVVDATQSAGAVPIDVAASGVDVLVTSGYKWLCGPFGVALMYLAPHLQGTLDPGIVGFRSHDDMWDLNPSRIALPGAARRFEFSTMSYSAAIGLTHSVEHLLGIGIAEIFAHNRSLADLLIDGLRARGAELAPELKNGERCSIVSARFVGRDAKDLARHLNAQRVAVSPRGDVVRFSPHLYNDAADIERALDEIDRHGD